MTRLLVAAIAGAALIPAPAAAQIVVSANESKVTIENGVITTVRNPPPDTVTIIDLGVSPPKVVAELPVPTSMARKRSLFILETYTRGIKTA